MRTTRKLATLVSLCAAVAVAAPAAAMAGASPSDKVLILDSTVAGGSSSLEGQAATAAGLGVDVVNDSQWSAMTAAQFASYRALILGDPSCGSSDTTPIAAAEGNRTVWSPIVNGNVVVIGTDPVFHNGGHPGAGKLIKSAINFTVDQVGKTALYADLSCYYTSGSTDAPVTVLDQFGTFKATSAGCADNIHIVASHPALAGLTDADLSNWSCSVHEYLGTFPASFTPLAIDTDAPPVYTAGDGTKGTPYILARGAGLSSSDISLTPASQSRALGSNAALTAFVSAGGSPQSGVSVTFKVVSGPNSGQTGTATTGSDGKATFTYSSLVTGTDTLQASFVDSSSHTQTSNPATVDWTGPPPTADLSIKKTGTPDPVVVGETLTYSLAVKNNGPGSAGSVTASDKLPAGVTFKSATSTQGSCTQSNGTVTCNLNSLANAATATVTIKVVPTATGTLSNTASVSSGQPDGNSANNSDTVETKVDAAASPTAGKNVGAQTDSGTATVKCPGQQQKQLTQEELIKLGCVIDATNGVVTLTWSTGLGQPRAARLRSSAAATTESGTFSLGAFQITQSKEAGRFYAVLALRGPTLNCAQEARLVSARRRHHRLFGRSRGHARTRSRHSAATVRGTEWSMDESCDGTLVKVFKGVVAVRDFELQKTVSVRAGHQYFARAEELGDWQSHR